MGRLTRSDCATVLLALPVALLAIWWLAMVVLGIAAAHPIWDIRPRNLSEAAAFRDGGAIVRRIRAGEDPTAAGAVRPGFISNDPLQLTPLEVAARERRSEIVELLLDLGVTPNEASWRRAWCATEDDEIRTLMAAARPPGTETDCGAK